MKQVGEVSQSLHFNTALRSSPNESNVPEPTALGTREPRKAQGTSRSSREEAPGPSPAQPRSTTEGAPFLLGHHLWLPGQYECAFSGRPTQSPLAGPCKVLIFLVGQVPPQKRPPGEGLVGALDAECLRACNPIRPLLQQ